MAQKQNPPKSTSSRQAETEGTKTWSDIGIIIWIRFERFAWDVGGVTLLAIAVMTLLALLLPQLAGGKLLTAIITNESIRSLALKEGVAACALIKASNIILAVND